ncbi:hypothetical protein Nwat_0693 [Nitrosococcus watsonii C-113]|uniref:Uncharacterized protein n=1 Tax=Nitrosococcus watsoni (strain C-113) TaxID=105559 RepID=D8KBN8_NITWC|nr:hypothetical protein Nwat_0693 [Nitrosococcus watsonii C-113]
MRPCALYKALFALAPLRIMVWDIGLQEVGLPLL